MPENLDFLNKRSRYVSILTYADELVINNVISEHENSIRASAWILHDKDVTKDGELKEAHYHVLLVLYDARTPNSVIAWFKKNTDQNVFAEPVKTNVRCAYQYLTHKNDDRKYRYPDDDVHHTNLDYWEKIDIDDMDDDNTALRIIEDLFNGTPYFDMVKRYGREFVINRKAYIDMAQMIRLDINPLRESD